MVQNICEKYLNLKDDSKEYEVKFFINNLSNKTKILNQIIEENFFLHKAGLL